MKPRLKQSDKYSDRMGPEGLPIIYRDNKPYNQRPQGRPPKKIVEIVDKEERTTTKK